MNIVITGASRGIGASITRAFVKEGDHQLFILARNIAKLKELTEACKLLNNKAKVIPVHCDITIYSELEKSVNEILSITSTIDILINNAGLAIRKPFTKFEYDEIESLMNTNFHAPANLIRLLIPALVKSKNAHVVNISSLSGFQGSKKFHGLSYYGASKAALACLTEILSEEFKGRGVSFNCLALGAVQTEMFSEVFEGYKAPVSSDQMGDFITNFALNAHNYMQGKVIPVSMSEP